MFGGVEYRHRYQDEVERFSSLATARAHCRRSGGRDGLVRFHATFLGRATESMLAMLPEEVREAAAPGVVVQVTAAVSRCRCGGWRVANLAAVRSSPPSSPAGGVPTDTMFSVFDAHPMTLKGLRAAGPPVLPAAQLLTMGLQLLDGLLFLQANRIAHCDVRDDNVLVDECGCCFIGDLSAAVELVCV